MKKLVAIAILLIFTFDLYAEECVRVKENGVGIFAKNQELGWLGLFYCLNFNDKEAVAEMLYRLSAHQECWNYIKIMDTQVAFAEIKEYINKSKRFFEYKEPRQGLRLLRMCMIIYESESYRNEVERIVKKYCKDCE